MVGSLTVLPALLAKLGRLVDRPRFPGLWRLNRRIGTGGISSASSARCWSGRSTSFAVALGTLVALSAPALGMTLHQGTIDTLPQDLAVSRRPTRRVQEHFPAERPTFEVVARADSADDAGAVGAALESIASQAQADAITSAGDEVVVSDDGRTALLRLDRDAAARATAANDGAVTQLRDSAVPAARRRSRRRRRRRSAATSPRRDDHEHQRRRLPLVIGFVLLLTMVMMVLDVPQA